MAESITLGYLRAVMTLDSAEFEAGVKGVSSSLDTLSKGLKSIGTQAVDIGKDMTAAFTVPIVAAFGGAAKAAIDFESAFAGVKKTVQDASENEFAAMAQAMRDLAKEIPINVNEIARLGEAAGALGIPKEQIVEFSRVMAELGVTTNLTADQAAESIAKIQNIFGAAGQETENFASSLVALGNAGASTETQILDMATRIAAAGHTIGLSEADVLGFANALASLGLEAEGGGTAISRTFIDIAKAVSDGGKELAAFAKIAGESSAQFSQQFKGDATEAITRFVEGLAKVKASGGDLIATLESIGVTEVRQRDALLRLAGAGDDLRTSIALSNDEWLKNTALTEEARKRFETTEAQLTLLWNRLKDVAITIGNALLPVIKDVVEKFKEWLPTLESAAKAFADLPVPVQEAAIAFAAMVAAIGPALIIFGQMSLGAASLTKAFTATGIATKVLSPLIGEMGSVGSLLVPTMDALAVGFTSWEGAIGLASRALAAIPGWGWIAIAVAGAFELAGGFERLGEKIGEAATAAGKLIGLIEAFGSALDRIQWPEMPEWLSSLGGWIAEGVKWAERLISPVAAFTALLNAIPQWYIDWLGGQGPSSSTPTLPGNPFDLTGVETREPVDYTKMSADVVAAMKAMDTAMAATTATQAKLTAEQKKYQEAVQDLYDKQIIQAVTQGLKDGTEWLDHNTSATEKAISEWAKWHPVLEGVADDFTRLDLSTFTDQAIALHGPLDDINAELERMHEATTSSIDLSGVFGEIHSEAEQAVIDFERMTEAEREAAAAAKAHEDALKRLGDSFYELGQTIGGVGGAIVGNIGDMLHVLDGIGAIHIPDSLSGGLSAVAEGALNVWHATDGASTGINTMNGAIAGAMAGLSPELVAATGGWSVAIGAAAGAITGLAKSAGNAKEELLASQDVLREWKDKVVEMFDATATGIQKLDAAGDANSKFTIAIRDAYADLGHTAAETHEVLTRLAEAMNDGPDAVKRVLDEINGELERHEQIMKNWAEGVQQYTAGFVERVDGFRQSLEGVTTATAEAQAGFDRMSSFAITAFASILEQTGSAYAALQAIQAPMNQLIALQEQLGLTGSATFQRLADISGIIQANQDIFQSIEGLQQMMMGLDHATLLTKDDVVLFGQDATALFGQLTAKGVDANTAMALMQPTLQMLWEQQQKFHVEVDDATQALLDQAVAMGVVGAEHKSINQQILDALLAVEAAINRLPEAFANANAAAANLLSTLKAIGTAEGQMQVGLGASTGSGGVATSVTDVQNDLMTRWEQMYGTRDIPATVKHAQNEAFIAQGVEPPWPGFAKGGMVSDWLQSMYGPGAVPIVAHVGEGILNPFATAALGGKSGMDALNTNPWSAVQRMASMQMPSPTGTASAPMSSGGMTIGDINITVHAPGGDPQAVARATKSAFDEWYDEVESGRGASRYRRLHQQVVVS